MVWDASTSVGSESSGSNTPIGLALVGKSISASCNLLDWGLFFLSETFWALLLMMQCTTRLLKDRSARQHHVSLFSKMRRNATHIFNVLSPFTWIVSFFLFPSEFASYCRCLVLRTAISFPLPPSRIPVSPHSCTKAHIHHYSCNDHHILCSASTQYTITYIQHRDTLESFHCILRTPFHDY